MLVTRLARLLLTMGVEGKVALHGASSRCDSPFVCMFPTTTQIYPSTWLACQSGITVICFVDIIAITQNVGSGILTGIGSSPE